MEKKNLLIVGAGQYGFVAKETAEATGKFEKIGFLDDNNPVAIGKVGEYGKFVGEYPCAFVAIGNAELRLFMLDALKAAGFELATLVSPKAYVSPSAQLGEGSIVEPFAAVQANATVGAGCILSAGSVVNHNAEVGKGAHIDCNATVTARAVVEEKTKIECGRVV